MKNRVMNKGFIIVLLLIFFLIFFLILFINSYYRYKYPLKYKDIIVEISNEYNLDSAFVASLINAESKYDKDVVSKKGAIGLMQIMPSTGHFIAKEIGYINFKEEDLFIPRINIKFGCYYIKYLSHKFDNEVNLLCAYNAGETVVINWLKDEKISRDGKELNKIPYLQTRNYISKVKESYKYYKRKFK